MSSSVFVLISPKQTDYQRFQIGWHIILQGVPFIVSPAGQLSGDGPADAGLLCDTPFLLRDTTKETPCTSRYKPFLCHLDPSALVHCLSHLAQSARDIDRYWRCVASCISPYVKHEVGHNVRNRQQWISTVFNCLRQTSRSDGTFFTNWYLRKTCERGTETGYKTGNSVSI